MDAPASLSTKPDRGDAVIYHTQPPNRPMNSALCQSKGCISWVPKGPRMVSDSRREALVCDVAAYRRGPAFGGVLRRPSMVVNRT